MMEKTLKFKELSAFVECSTGNTPTVKAFKKYISLLSKFGYTHLYLGLTDGYKMEGEPYFNLGRGGYTTKQLQEMDAYAQEQGIELRANIQVLGHLHFLPKHDCYRDLFDTSHVLMVGKEEVYQLVEKMIATISAGLKSRTIHLGMDEAGDIGLGRYLAENGYTDRKQLLLQHLQRVVEIAKKYGYFCEMWSDTFFSLIKDSDLEGDKELIESVRNKIPEGVRLVHWRYMKLPEEQFRKDIAHNKALCDDVAFAGSAMKLHGLAPDNQYSIDTMEEQMRICQEEGVENFIVTMWSDVGAHCSIFSVLPALYATAEIARGKKSTEIDKARFKEIVGVAYDDFMLLDNLNNPFFKKLENMNSRSYWGLLSDIFLGNYDLYLSENTNEAYAALSQKYADVEAGEYRLLFDDFKLYAKVLSIRMNLGPSLRKAYREGQKALLEHYAKTVIPEMIDCMLAYMHNFEKRWLSENMSFGLEVHHLFYGGQIERWHYIERRLLQYLQNGETIEEMERDELLPCIIPQTDEDSCLELNYRNLISYCSI